MKSWPAKTSLQKPLLAYPGSRLEAGREYNAVEINNALKSLNSFGDHSLLRRELVDQGIVERTADGKLYRLMSP